MFFDLDASYSCFWPPMIFIASLSFAAWVYLALFHGLFWRSKPVLEMCKPIGKAKVAVVVPARDEAASIERCLRSLLTQNYAGELAIILVDDNSTDGTAQLASALAASLDNGAQLAIINGKPLEPGWSGKLWAVDQGLAHPLAAAADYVLLTDADIEHAPDHVSTLVAKAEADGLDLVSEMVRLNCATFAERALIPAFVFFFQMLYPFAWTADPRKRTAGAAGGTMLVARAALSRIDGVRCIRHQLIDDCALAKEIKSSGGRIWIGHSEHAVSLRVYPSWREVWNMIARTAYVQLNHSPLLLAGSVLGMGLLYVAPPVLALKGASHLLLSQDSAGAPSLTTFFVGKGGGEEGITALAGFSAWLLMAALFQPTLRRYRVSPLWGLVLPAIGLFYLCATVASAFRHYAGRGGGWKNRVYPEQRGPDQRGA